MGRNQNSQTCMPTTYSNHADDGAWVHSLKFSFHLSRHESETATLSRQILPFSSSSLKSPWCLSHCPLPPPLLLLRRRQHRGHRLLQVPPRLPPRPRPGSPESFDVVKNQAPRSYLKALRRWEVEAEITVDRSKGRTNFAECCSNTVPKQFRFPFDFDLLIALL